MGTAVSFLNSSRRFEMLRGNALHVLRQLPDESIDAFVSDAPYGIELKLKSKRIATSIAGDGKLEARKLWKAFIPECYRAAKPDTAHIFFASWKSPWMHAVLSRHFNVKAAIVWDKKVRSIYSHYLRPQWEMAFFCTKGKPERVKPVDGDLWTHQRVMRPNHPCEKPVDMLRRAVRLVARTGQLVADPFAGIGSTGVAALAEGCRFLGVEIDARHHRLGIERLRSANST